jgi:hypothetical protein
MKISRLKEAISAAEPLLIKEARICQPLISCPLLDTKLFSLKVAPLKRTVSASSNPTFCTVLRSFKS